jgi:hypothetical protein
VLTVAGNLRIGCLGEVHATPNYWLEQKAAALRSNNGTGESKSSVIRITLICRMPVPTSTVDSRRP